MSKLVNFKKFGTPNFFNYILFSFLLKFQGVWLSNSMNLGSSVAELHIVRDSGIINYSLEKGGAELFEFKEFRCRTLQGNTVACCS